MANEPPFDSLRMIYGRIPLGANMPITVDPLLLALAEDEDDDDDTE